jgi:hypothetical protein
MNRVGTKLMSLTLALVVAAPLFAADKERKKKPRKKPDPATGILKRFEKAELTEEQVAKVKELAAKVAKDTAECRKKAAPTPEQQKARKEAMEKAKADGKEGREVFAAARDAVKLTPEQEEAMKEVRKAQAAMMKEILGMLSDEQKAKLGKRPGAKKPRKKPGAKKKAVE